MKDALQYIYKWMGKMCLVLGLIVLALTGYAAWKFYSTTGGTTGTIVDSELIDGTKNTYQALYEYTVDGKIYQSKSTETFNGVPDNGMEIKIHYMKDNPEELTNSTALYSTLTLGLAFVGVGIAFDERKKKKKVK